ncbi:MULTISPECIES: hypothetical protein [unclassified Novosphingobium]|uniref:hypothetical protein n=1 Tax=unclassified Novosphingobium TaxID=2644732 RepID=UPI0013596AF6|nr:MULTISPECIES: hypothetical protein [unclassified Novosphingobium]
MYQDDEPLNSLGTPRKFASIKSAIPAMPHAGAASDGSEEDMLFEDILDIEGPLHLAMNSVAGFGAPAVGQIDKGIGELAGRISDADFAQLRTQAQALNTAIDAGDAAQVRASQAAIIETLTSLRRALA